MMTKPGITELDRCVDSRYTLVSMVAKRARMIGTQRKHEEEEGKLEMGLEKPVTQALEEISKGVVSYVRSEAIEKAREYEEEKYEAISQLERDMINPTEEKKVAEVTSEETQTENTENTETAEPTEIPEAADAAEETEQTEENA